MLILQNVATESIAAQGAILGYNGLVVVGGETVMGILNATGGITTKALTATSATVSGSVSTSNINSTTATLTSATIPTLVSTTGTITNLSATTITAANETLSGSLTASTVNTTTLNTSGTSYLNNIVMSGNMSGTNAFFQNIAGESIAAQGAILGYNGLVVVGGETVMGVLNATGGITTKALTATSATVSGSVSTSNINSTTATLTSATIPTLVSTTGSITNLSSTTITAANETLSGSLTASTVNTTTLNTSGTSYLNNIVMSGNMSGSNVFFQNVASEHIAAQGAILGYDGLVVIGGETIMGLLNATGGLTTTSFASTSATVSGSVSASNVNSTTATLTSATIPTLVSTTGSITNLSSTTITAANETLSGSLTASTVNTTTLNTSGTSYLNEVIVSGNMSGSNVFFQNSAIESIAAQGAIIGYDGLMVVGGETVIGLLNATGGITTTSLSTNSIVSNSVSSSSVSSTTANITILNANKLIGSSSTPTVSFTGSTGAYDLSVIGNDIAGKVLFKLDQNFTDGVLFNIDFATPYTNIPVVVYSPARPDSSYINYNSLIFVITSTTGFQLIVDDSLPLALGGNLLDIVFNYHVIGK
jgi:trimeric autotransporter adhesin